MTKRTRKSALSVPERHQLKIARDTLRMPDPMVAVMGGPTKAQAREIIRRLTGRKENPSSALDIASELENDFSSKELFEFWNTHQHGRNSKKLGLTGKNSRLLTADLANFAANLGTAKNLRLTGNITDAQRYELIADKIYTSIVQRQKNPLAKGYSRKTVGKNIKREIARGKKQSSAVAMSLAEARKDYRKKHPRGPLPKHLRLKLGAGSIATGGDKYLAYLNRRKNPSGVRIVHNKLLGGWFVVRGPHQTPLNGRFNSKAEAQAYLQRKSRMQNPDIHIDIGSHNTKGRNVRARNPAYKYGKDEIIAQMKTLSNLLGIPLALESQTGMPGRVFKITYDNGARNLSRTLHAREMEDWLHGAISVGSLFKHGLPR